jgi:uncharacterized protein (DUF2147 family)
MGLKTLLLKRLRSLAPVGAISAIASATATVAALSLPPNANAVAAKPVHAVPEGLWRNPRRSVVVRTGECGANLCGWVVWANAEARSDASEKSTRALVGTELLHDYRRDGAGRWSGTVYVPDLGRSFASEIIQLSSTQLKIRGCVLHGVLCKSQVWDRVNQTPAA